MDAVSKGQSPQQGRNNHDFETPTQEPWLKWVEMQQQLMTAIKGAQNALKNVHDKSLIRGQERPVRALALASRDPNGGTPASTMVQLE